MGRVHRPEALSSSSKMVMIGTNFCLLSSDDTKLLSSWMEHGQHGGHPPAPAPRICPGRVLGLEGFGDI